MTTRDRLLGLTVVLLWGLNFLAIRAGLDRYPPFFFAALRFLVIAVPVIAFVPRPNVPVRWLLLYGTGFGVLQFGFLFTAMNAGMPTGLASLVLQSSAPFTVVLGVLFLRERVHPRQVLGIAVAICGMVAIGWDRAQHATLLPVLLTLPGLGVRQHRLAIGETTESPTPDVVDDGRVAGSHAGALCCGRGSDGGLESTRGVVQRRRRTRTDWACVHRAAGNHCGIRYLDAADDAIPRRRRRAPVIVGARRRHRRGLAGTGRTAERAVVGRRRGRDRGRNGRDRRSAITRFPFKARRRQYSE